MKYLAIVREGSGPEENPRYFRVDGNDPIKCVEQVLRNGEKYSDAEVQEANIENIESMIYFVNDDSLVVELVDLDKIPKLNAYW